MRHITVAAGIPGQPRPAMGFDDSLQWSVTHTLSHFRCYAVVPLNHMMLLSDLAKSGVHPFSTFQVVHFRFRIFQTTFALSCFIPSRVASDWLRGPLVSNSISHFFFRWFVIQSFYAVNSIYSGLCITNKNL